MDWDDGLWYVEHIGDWYYYWLTENSPVNLAILEGYGGA